VSAASPAPTTIQANALTGGRTARSASGRSVLAQVVERPAEHVKLNQDHCLRVAHVQWSQPGGDLLLYEARSDSEQPDEMCSGDELPWSAAQAASL